MQHILRILLYAELAFALYTCTDGFSLLQLAGICSIITTLCAVQSDSATLRLALATAVYSAWKFSMGWWTLVGLSLDYSQIPAEGVNTSFIRLFADPEHRAAVVATEMRKCE